jgi:hypothetical protein
MGAFIGSTRLKLKVVTGTRSLPSVDADAMSLSQLRRLFLHKCNLIDHPEVGTILVEHERQLRKAHRAPSDADETILHG